MKKILIFGATSLIAEKCCKIWAKKNYELFLVGRDLDRLKIISTDLKIRYSTKINIFQSDLIEIKNHEKCFLAALKILKKFDIILLAHGSLSNEDKARNEIDYALEELELNALSFISLLILASKYLEITGGGIIALLSSVAGERGKSSNYLYGSAKSMINTYCSGMRQWYFNSNISIVTINLGFVDTPMTKNFKKNFLWSSADKVAAKIIKAIDKKRDIVYIPKFWFIILFIIKAIPENIFKRIKL